MKRLRRNQTNQPKEISSKQLQRRTFLSTGIFAALNIMAFGLWRWLYHSPLEKEGVTAGARRPLRSVLNSNEKLFSKQFSPDHLVKTYPKSMAAKNVRVNSDIGMTSEDFDLPSWSLQIKRNDGSKLSTDLELIKRLPKTEIVFDFKCVEGWDQISWWGGVKFSDFVEHLQLQDQIKSGYVGLATPDEEYYVGIDMPSAMHPQTILAYEVNGKTLPLEHGFPLRLIIPVKYGIKHLKRIGKITFNDTRPPDYWAERGYDYFSGL